MITWQAESRRPVLGNLNGGRAEPNYAGQGDATATRILRGPGAAKRSVLFVLSLSAYAALLHWTYQNTISPLFSYSGLRYRDPDPTSYLVAYILAATVGLILPGRLRRPSDFVLWVLYVMTCVPSILVPQYAYVITPAASLELAFVVASSFLVLIIIAGRTRGLHLPRLRVPRPVLWLALGIVTVFVYGYMLSVTGLHLRFMSLTAVQSTRFSYRDAIATSGTALAYLIGVQGNVINPLFMARGLYSRNWVMFGVGAVGQMLIYSSTGYKMMILSVPVVLAMGLLFRRSGTPLGRLIIDGTLATGLMALLADRIMGAHEFSLVFIGRLALIPGTLTAAYVLVFAEQAKALWGYSFLAPFVAYPYPTSPALLVGAEFSGDSQVAANTNFLGDGYANLGYAGIFIEAIVIGVLLLAFNGAAKGLPMKTSSMLLLIPSLALVNTSVFTSILTGGCAFAILVLMALPRDGWGEAELVQVSPDSRSRRLAKA